MRTDRKPFTALLLVLILCGTSPLVAQASAPEAPEWSIVEWINGDPGPLASQRGRVVLLNFFQLWCPGSNSFLIPLFQRWQEQYGSRDDVLLVSIHSVFEGQDVQTPARLREFVRSKGIVHPVGIDAHPDEDDPIPITMRRYRTAGTPQVVIIDKQGRIRFSHLGSFDARRADALIKKLLGDDPEDRPARTLRL